MNSPGEVEIKQFANLGAAIAAANGFRRNRLLFPPGLITIRARRKYKSESKRKLNNPDYVRKRINFKNNPAVLGSVRLFKGDHIVVQFGGLGLSWWYGRNGKV